MKISDLKAEILAEAKRIEFNVFFRSDFTDLGSYSQVGKALSELCKEQKMLRMGKGLYCLAKISRFSGKCVPDGTHLPEIAHQALTRLGYELVLSKAQIDLQEKRSTQVPTGRRLAIKGKKTKRKIGHDNIYVSYEYV
jgi:Family of unknown function (DUF6088)